MRTKPTTPDEALRMLQGVGETPTHCALCRKTAPIRNSHIVPKFVFDWLKETSGTGFVRVSLRPNKAERDGLKRALLCGDCESLLSSWEKPTAEQVFRPLLEDPSRTVRYGPWFLKFCVSVSWRVLTVYRQIRLRHLTADQVAAADLALRTWAEFLLGSRPHPAEFEQHVLPLDVVEGLGGMQASPNLNRYLLRCVDIDVAANSKSTFVYSKMCGLLVVGFIEMPNPRDWRGMKVHVSKGTLGSRKYEVPGKFGEFLIAKARKMAKSQDEISARQRQKIADKMMSDLDRAASSESFRVFSHDVSLFGRDAFSREPDAKE